MNKLVALLIGGVIIVGGGVTYVLTRGSDDNSVKVTNSATGQSQELKTGDSAIVAVDACEVLTQGIADQVLGTTATKGDTTAGNTSSDAVSVSNCTYYVRPANATPAQIINNTKGVSVLVRAAKNQSGVESNKAVFGPQKPSGVQDVSGFGDKAYYNPQYGQLNVLKGGNWYILSHYEGKPTTGTLEQNKQLAAQIQFK